MRRLDLPAGTGTTPRNWIAVACAEHARRGRDAPGGYMQVCHGKLAPLRRVLAGEPYPSDMDGGFVPYRRDVAYLPAKEAAIQPLLDALEFVEDRGHWGYPFRFGLFAVSNHDMRLIADAMHADLARLCLMPAGPSQGNLRPPPGAVGTRSDEHGG
jgi:hypothetical protein